MILVACVFMHGCAFSASQRPGPIDYRTGSEGLSVRFVTNNPPYQLYDDEEVHVILEVWNRGAHEVSSESKVYLSGFDKSIVLGMATSGQPLTKLEGKTQYNPTGTYTNVEFQGDLQNLAVKNIDRLAQTFLATICYEYETLASGTICLDPDPFSRSATEKICTPGPVSLGTQGAPVAVSSVDVEPLKGKARFRINIANVGGGLLFRPGSQYLGQCNPYSSTGLGYKDVDYVRIDDVKVGSTSIKSSCKPVSDVNYVRLDNGAASIYCELTTLTGPVVQSPIMVSLAYGYRTSASTNIEIIATGSS